jgi:hypothetical protein
VKGEPLELGFEPGSRVVGEPAALGDAPPESSGAVRVEHCVGGHKGRIVLAEEFATNG